MLTDFSSNIVPSTAQWRSSVAGTGHQTLVQRAGVELQRWKVKLGLSKEMDFETQSGK
jgi:hypothetical protein